MNRSDYASARARLLDVIVGLLKEDARFVAAWLTGSFGRGEADDLSDLDLMVVVADAAAAALCDHSRPVGAATNAERFAVFSAVGRPTIIYEAHVNAPEGGTFASVIYADSALVVDWVFVPHAQARRPSDSLLLFGELDIPVEPAASVEPLADRAERASERVAFFWMMLFPTIKALARGDAVRFHLFLDILHRSLLEVERLVRGEPPRYQGASSAQLHVTRAEQIAALRRLCDRMIELGPTVEGIGGGISESPMPVIETMLSLVDADFPPIE